MKYQERASEHTEFANKRSHVDNVEIGQGLVPRSIELAHNALTNEKPKMDNFNQIVQDW
jgi:hypothetical protein